MNKALERALRSTYRQFGITAKYLKKDILSMLDENLSFEHDLQRAIKIRSNDINLKRDTEGILHLPSNEIFFKGKMRKIQSWTFHGNDLEEIILLIEWNGRW